MKKVILILFLAISNILGGKYQAPKSNDHQVKKSKPIKNIINIDSATIISIKKAIEDQDLNLAKSLIKETNFFNKDFRLLKYRNTNLLHLAAFFNIKNNLDLIIKSNDINSETKFGNTALTIAMQKNNLKIIQKLLYLKNTLNINHFGENKLTVLHKAAQFNSIRSLSEIMPYASSELINSQNKYGETALHIAAYKGYVEIIELLIKFNANIFLKNKTGMSPLELALSKKNYKSGNVLLKHINLIDSIADKNILNNLSIKEALDLNCLEVAKFIALSKYNCDNDIQKILSHPKCSIAHLCACFNKHHDSLENNLDEINSIVNGMTPLFIACKKGYYGIAKILLDLGANANIKTNDISPLMIAQSKNHTNTINLLNEYALKPRLLKKEKNALEEAIKKYDLPLAKQIINNSNLSIETKKFLCDDKCDLIHIMAYFNIYKNLQKLHTFTSILEKKHPVNELSPLFIASEQGNTDFAENILKLGASPNTTTDNGWTPLHIASRRGYTDIVKLLISYNTDVNLTQVDNWTALDFAKEKNHTEIIKILSSKNCLS